MRVFFRGSYRVTGRVQGVGFRYSTLHHANRIGLTGFVRNLPDGSVEAVAEGTAEQLDVFESFLKEGPSLSRVEHLSIARVETDNREYRNFSVH